MNLIITLVPTTSKIKVNKLIIKFILIVYYIINI